MQTKSSLAVCIFASLLFSVACGGSESKKEAKSGAVAASKDGKPVASGSANSTTTTKPGSTGGSTATTTPGNTADSTNLTGSKWDRCGLIFSRIEGGKPDIYVYGKTVMTFSDSKKAEVNTEFFAKDKNCAEKITLDEAKTLSEDAITELYKFSLELGASTKDAGIFEANVTIFNTKLYLLAKIGPSTLEISDQCVDQTSIDEGHCKKIDGDKPDNRATTFGMFPDDRTIYKIVK